MWSPSNTFPPWPISSSGRRMHLLKQHESLVQGTKSTTISSGSRLEDSPRQYLFCLLSRSLAFAGAASTNCDAFYNALPLPLSCRIPVFLLPCGRLVFQRLLPLSFATSPLVQWRILQKTRFLTAGLKCSVGVKTLLHTITSSSHPPSSSLRL